jgi:hypothetical protein
MSTQFNKTFFSCQRSFTRHKNNFNKTFKSTFAFTQISLLRHGDEGRANCWTIRKHFAVDERIIRTFLCGYQLSHQKLVAHLIVRRTQSRGGGYLHNAQIRSCAITIAPINTIFGIVLVKRCAIRLSKWNVRNILKTLYQKRTFHFDNLIFGHCIVHYYFFGYFLHPLFSQQKQMNNVSSLISINSL